MQAKTFELRDRATFIPLLAIPMLPSHKEEDIYLFRRAGYAVNPEYLTVMLINLSTGESHMNYYEWENSRTYRTAHLFICNNWDKLESGAVIDIEYLLGETEKPKESEKLFCR